MNETPSYPASITGELVPELSRWLWLVKWFLLIPHIIVLAFLWTALFVLTVIAFFAILFTGKYPRGIFDFNLGVLRWSWRVGFYSYNALGTDRYPPFSLKEEADYPATLQIEYPERLSRGLVLVKRWLLAIPHFLLLALLSGGIGARTPGVSGLLVLFAGVVMLFGRRYPTEMYDLVMGINRWTIRVAAYALLMTDEYPPFSLR
jgi:hypothetical protein